MLHKIEDGSAISVADVIALLPEVDEFSAKNVCIWPRALGG